MSSNSCRYDCSERLENVSPYPDISGTGVVIGYVATAGIVVAIIVIYYFASYDPEKDPFQRENPSAGASQRNQYRPNPVDVAIRQEIRRFARRAPRIVANEPLRPHNFRLEESCIKCVLSMSDLQILTGVSILISGYFQLRCGLSSYHWQVLVYLAWFSSITHLSCLTFLRNYLYNRPGERAWRLVAMAILLIMLVVAVFPTGNYSWPIFSEAEPIILMPNPTPSDYAICYLNCPNDVDPISFASMIISIFLLVYGCMSRVIRLHKLLSVNFVGRLRRAASEWSQKNLLRAYEKLKVERYPKSLRRTMVYRPILAVFLAFRVSLDVWSSMFAEDSYFKATEANFIKVWWLVASFVWVFVNLIGTLALSNGGNSDWTFGQVAPVVLLITPLLAISEYLYPSKHDKALQIIRKHAECCSRGLYRHEPAPTANRNFAIGGGGWLEFYK